MLSTTRTTYTRQQPKYIERGSTEKKNETNKNKRRRKGRHAEKEKTTNWQNQISQIPEQPENQDNPHREPDAAAGVGFGCSWSHCHAVCHLLTWETHEAEYRCRAPPPEEMRTAIQDKRNRLVTHPQNKTYFVRIRRKEEKKEFHGGSGVDKIFRGP